MFFAVEHSPSSVLLLARVLVNLHFKRKVYLKAEEVLNFDTPV